MTIRIEPMTISMRPFLTLLILLLSVSAFAQMPGDDPIEYNNAIIREQTRIIQANTDYNIASVHSENENEVQQKRQVVIQTLQEAITHIREIPPHRSDSKLKEDALEYFEMYLNTYQDDVDALELLKKDRESSYEAMEAFFKANEKVQQKLRDAGDRFREAQEAFAARQELTLTDHHDILQDKVKQIGEVNRYSNKMFLIFFRVSKAEAIYMDALDNKKPKDMEQARLDLLTAADASYNELRKTLAFKGDNTLRGTTMSVITYMRELASKDFNLLVDIIKREESWTQADVDNYNEIIRRYNKEFPKNVNRFYDARQNLLRKHTPQN